MGYLLKRDSLYFNVIDTEEKSYFLGFLFADGCNTGNGFTVQLQAGDADVLTALKNALGAEHKISAITRKDGRKHVGLTICDAALSAALSRWGCVPRKSLVVKFPDNFPSALERHFIRGFFDGNGYISDVTNLKSKLPVQVMSLTSTRSFCTSVASIVSKKCGVHCGLEANIRNAEIWQLRIGGRLQVVKVLEYLYGGAKIALNRKWSLANRLMTEEFVSRRYLKKIPA
jgi:hypothetical protein